jgi:hypothetical protein
MNASKTNAGLKLYTTLAAKIQTSIETFEVHVFQMEAISLPSRPSPNVLSYLE